MIIEGKNAIREALLSNKSIDKLYVLKGYTDNQIQYIIDMAKEAKARIIFTDKKSLDKLTPNKHQNVVANVADIIYVTIDDILNKARSLSERAFIIILDSIEDPHNLGSIIRSAETAGAHGIIIPNVRAVGITDTVVRVSAGAISHIDIARVTNINDAIRYLKDKFVKVFSADVSGKSIYHTNLSEDIAVVIGNEGYGVKPLTLKLSDDIINIPMRGRLNSLNASVAAGIIMYEVIRQRHHG